MVTVSIQCRHQAVFQLSLIAAFLRRFGVPTTGNDIGYAIPAPWQSGLSNGASAGGIIGLLINGWAADKYGPKIVMMVSTVALAGFIFLSVFAQNLGQSLHRNCKLVDADYRPGTLVAAQVLCGLPWGVFQTLVSLVSLVEVCHLISS